MKKNIAIVAGGYTSEFSVSMKSAFGLKSFIDSDLYNCIIVVICGDSWSAILDERSAEIDRNDFSYIGVDGQRHRFDFAYVTVHGSPGEDGRLQGYFDMIGMPYSSCGVLAGALSFNKYFNNQYLKSQGIRIAEAVRLTARQWQASAQEPNESIIARLGLPVFVKPNEGGSSFGVSKVKAAADLTAAIESAFNESDEVIIESEIKGVEVTCGCYKTRSKEVVLPLTEIVSENEFFDYEAKYSGKSKEYTPARLPADVAGQVQRTTLRVYDLIGARGVIRIDYIIPESGEPTLLEINTNPGMTEASIIPQQVKAAGLDIKQVMSEIIEDCLQKKC